MTQLVKYYGRFELIPSTELAKVERDMNSLIYSFDHKPEVWKPLQNHIMTLHNNINTAMQTNSGINYRRFQIELLDDAILPYLHQMVGPRYTLDCTRFQQIIRLLQIVDEPIKGMIASSHPAQSLESVQQIVDEINSAGHWFPSQLAGALKAAVTRQWAPIIVDLRGALRHIGGRFVAMALVDMFGDTMMVAVVLCMLTTTAMCIFHDVQVNHGLSFRNLGQLVKCAILYVVLQLLLSVMALLAGMGHVCLLIGVASLAVSCNENQMKIIAPIVAPQLSVIDLFLEQVTSLNFALRGARHRALAVVTAVAVSDNNNVTTNTQQHVNHTATGSVAVPLPVLSVLASVTTSSRSLFQRHRPQGHTHDSSHSLSPFPAECAVRGTPSSPLLGQSACLRDMMMTTSGGRGQGRDNNHDNDDSTYAGYATLAGDRDCASVCTAGQALEFESFATGVVMRKKLSSEYSFKDRFVWLDRGAGSIRWSKSARLKHQSKQFVVSPDCEVRACMSGTWSCVSVTNKASGTVLELQLKKRGRKRADELVQDIESMIRLSS